MKEKLELLNIDERAILKDGLKTYLAYQQEINETREVMKDQISRVASEVKTLTKKEVKKLFAYLKKNTTPDELREDAEALEEVDKYIKVCEKVRDDKPVFRLIIDDKGKEMKKDPILLALSPFGKWYHFLGAWDEEVKYVDDIIYNGK